VPDPGSSSKQKAGVLPPPPGAGDAPGTVSVPPLEPPPRSLEAMVQSRIRPKPRAAEKNPWLLLFALFLLGMLVTMYFQR